MDGEGKRVDSSAVVPEEGGRAATMVGRGGGLSVHPHGHEMVGKLLYPYVGAWVEEGGGKKETPPSVGRARQNMTHLSMT